MLHYNLTAVYFFLILPELVKIHPGFGIAGIPKHLPFVSITYIEGLDDPTIYIKDTNYGLGLSGLKQIRYSFSSFLTLLKSNKFMALLCKPEIW